jgi:hypothetical protein
VSKLRGKLEVALPDRRFIHTHQGFGYRFQPEPSREAELHGAAGSHLTSDGASVNSGATGLATGAPGLSRDVHISISDS